MQIQHVVSARLHSALEKVAADCLDFAERVRPTQNPKFGDFQIDCAMPLANRLGESPRHWAAQIVEALDVDDFCHTPEIAGSGYINLRIREDWLADVIKKALRDPRSGVGTVATPKTILIDFSSPNVAKPMHVGHIRSTVIGDALTKIFKFLGHHVITDNHLGDWGTQFGMVIYGYRNFLDPVAFEKGPVPELLRIYKLVNQLMGYHNSLSNLDSLQSSVEQAERDCVSAQERIANCPKEENKKRKKELRGLQKKSTEAVEELEEARKKIAVVESDPQLLHLAQNHANIGSAVLEETAKLHAGDADNLQLWQELMPYGMDEVNRVYRRLKIEFDHVLGESFYHPMLADVVAKFQEKGLSRISEGAVCVFLDGFDSDSPMIIQKQDGAFLYATTDLATIQYRQKTFQPDEILYVVDSRQELHFRKLFAAAILLGVEGIRLVHVNFGTVQDESGRPLKTRSGALAGLETLLDEAVDKAFSVVCDSEHAQRANPPFTEEEKREISERVGIGAIKYADLAHHRTSDYKFILEKMVSLEGNTSAYIQYAYARVQGILRSAGITEQDVINSEFELTCEASSERNLLISLLRFEEILHMVHSDYAPNILVDYLYEIAKGLAVMYEQCPVLKAETEALKHSRIGIITFTAQVLRRGLALLGIEVVPRM